MELTTRKNGEDPSAALELTAWALDRNRYLELLTWAAVTGPMGAHVLITRKISKRRSIASEGCKRSSSEERLCSAWQ